MASRQFVRIKILITNIEPILIIKQIICCTVNQVHKEYNMDEIISYDEILEWRRSTEKITLEEFARRRGKKLCSAKESNDLYDIVRTQEKAPVEIVPEVLFKKALTDREKIVFNYLNQNKGKVVFVKELAKILKLPNDYVYKYIKNIREKLVNDVLENAEKGGYILHI